MNPILTIIELALRVTLAAMEGQTPEQKKIMWDFFIEGIQKIRSDSNAMQKFFEGLLQPKP